MRVKLRLTGGDHDVEVSKAGFVGDLLKNAEEQIAGFTATSSRLLFRGGFLDSEKPLLIYKISENDVISVLVRQALSPLSVNNNNDVGEKDKTSKEENYSVYFAPGDNLIYKTDATGEWREGKVEIVEPSSNECQTLFRILDGSKGELVSIPETGDLLRPCPSDFDHVEKLELGDKVLAFIDDESNSGWFLVKITKLKLANSIRQHSVHGCIVLRDNTELDECRIKYYHNLYKLPVYEPRVKWSQVQSREGLPTPCDSCLDCRSLKCKECSCAKCGGKENEEQQIICEECEKSWHIYCLNPPLEKIPDDDWYCKDCCNNDGRNKKAKMQMEKKAAQLAKSIKKSSMSRDWGTGLCTAAVTNRFSTVPNHHFGKVPGVPSGRLWKNRIDVCRLGVHRPPVAGISGTATTGAHSVCFSGGYDGDQDKGVEFIMSGSGGRDLSGNKRTSSQSSDQELTRFNLALARNCFAKINAKDGADAGPHWRKGVPIRVVRGYKLTKISKFAPSVGYRYDGLYKIVKYYKEQHKGFAVWRFLFRRDDEEPAPWTKEGVAYMKKMSVGHLEGDDVIEEKKEKNDDQPPNRKRKADTIPKGHPPLKKHVTPYKLPKDIEAAIAADKINKSKWDTVVESHKKGYPDFIKCLADEFICQVCQEIVKKPVTLPCSHNLCMSCKQKWFSGKENGKACPSCRQPAGEELAINRQLMDILHKLLPGYDG